MRRIVAAAVVLGVLAPLPASAATDIASVRIKPQVQLVDGGDAVLVTVMARCTDASYHVLEAFVYVNQDGFTSQFAAIPLDCGESRMRRFTVRADSFDDWDFHAGSGTASAFVLVSHDETNETAQAQDNRAVRIR